MGILERQPTKGCYWVALTSQKVQIHKSWKDRRLSAIRTRENWKVESKEHKKKERNEERNKAETRSGGDQKGAQNFRG